MNAFLKFSLSLITLLILVVLIDQIIGKVLRNLYFKQESGLLYRTTYSIDSTKADVLVFGSSRANHHYVPEVFEDSLKMSFYNTGREGNFLLYNYAVFKAIINRYTPKMVLFDLNPGELFYDSDSYNRLSSLLPYYKDHPEIRSIVNLKSPYERFKLISAIYPFNSLLLTIITGNLDMNKQRKDDRDGYIPLKNILSDSSLTVLDPVVSSRDINKLEALKDVIKICESNGILLFLIESPVYAYVIKDPSASLIKQMAHGNGIYFLNYTNDSNFIKVPSYFQDREHLNEKGATRYSKLLVEEILNTKKRRYFKELAEHK